MTVEPLGTMAMPATVTWGDEPLDQEPVDGVEQKWLKYDEDNNEGNTALYSTRHDNLLRGDTGNLSKRAYRGWETLAAQRDSNGRVRDALCRSVTTTPLPVHQNRQPRNAGHVDRRQGDRGVPAGHDL